MNRTPSHRLFAPLTAVLLCVALTQPSLPVGATDFIRGDTSGDGNVDLGDAYLLLAHLFSGVALECRTAADADDSGRVNFSDAIIILNSLKSPDIQIAAPYPEPGPDTTANIDNQPCDSYGGGQPVDDPAAELGLLEAVANGGEATITVYVSSSRDIAGYQADIDMSTSPVDGVPPSGLDPFFGTPRFPDPQDLTLPAEEDRFPLTYVRPVDDVIRFGYLRGPVYLPNDWIPAGNQTPVLRFDVCLEAGTPAGEYPIQLQSGSLIDGLTGQRIPATLASGTLTVPEAVPSDVECFVESIPSECTIEEVDPSQVSASFALTGGAAPAGAEVDVLFTIDSTDPVQGFAISVDFDEEVVNALDLAPIFEKPDGTPYDFAAFDINNDNNSPGSDGIDEGHLSGAAVFSFTNACNNLPAGNGSDVLRLRFRIAEGATPGETAVTFLSGAQGRGQPIENAVQIGGASYEPDVVGSFLFVDASIEILADGSLFRRGDSNRDGDIDLSDAVNVLDHLFLGVGSLSCPDAADADDNGELNLTDPIRLLNHLFLGGASLPPPTVEEGVDPTLDALHCFGKP